MGSNKTQEVRNINEDIELLQAQAEVHNHLFAYADTLVLRSAVELRIADIIHSHSQPITLSQIASKIDSPNVDVTFLARVMRMLVRKKIFTVEYKQNQSAIGEAEEEQALYGLTSTSDFLRHDHEFSLAPSFLRLSHHTMVKPWYEISRSIKEGGNPFVRTHGVSLWEMASKDVEFNELFNKGMASSTKTNLDAVIKGYKDGFSKLEGSLVDVAGGTGSLVAKIVETYPHIKGFNFDLPHVVANGVQVQGVTHVGGDIFKEIPSADNVIIKSVLLDWADEDCIRILKNCEKAVSEKKGKVIIVDIVLHPERYEMFDDATIALDMLMMTNCINGKNRTKGEWEKLLKEAGFSHFNFLPLQTSMSLTVIEAFLH